LALTRLDGPGDRRGDRRAGSCARAGADIAVSRHRKVPNLDARRGRHGGRRRGRGVTSRAARPVICWPNSSAGLEKPKAWKFLDTNASPHGTMPL
jgi:hypothetical protein